MNLKPYMDKYISKKLYTGLITEKQINILFFGNKPYSLSVNPSYTDPLCLEENIKISVKAYTREKDTVIKIYKKFIEFLKTNKIFISVNFPPISISNSFERLMFISKYLHDPKHKVSDLPDLLWVSERTIDNDIKRLKGKENPIQVCGKPYIIDDIRRSQDSFYVSSTSHPLFLTPNLTQALITLKGLKKMSEDPLYYEYAMNIAADIWEQLSDYAKERIRFVFTELLPEDLEWYENLKKEERKLFYTEKNCSKNFNILDCLKNNKPFFVEYNGENGICFFENCIFIPGTFKGNSLEVKHSKGRVRLYFDKIIRNTYSIEELMSKN